METDKSQTVPPKATTDTSNDYITLDFKGLTLPWAIVISVIILTGGIGAAVYFGLKARPVVQPSSTTTNTTSNQTSDPKPTDFHEVTVDVGDAEKFGNTNAKVVVMEFGDFVCPACGSFFNSTYKQIKANYIDNNKIGFIFKNYPIASLHDPAATTAARVGLCIYKNYGADKFSSYHDAFFTNVGTLATGSAGDGVNTRSVYKMNDKNFDSVVASLGVNAKQMRTCSTTSTILTQLQAEKKQFEDLSDYYVKQNWSDDGYGLGTPSVIVGILKDGKVTGRLFPGGYPYSIVQQVIEEQLAKAN